MHVAIRTKADLPKPMAQGPCGGELCQTRLWGLATSPTAAQHPLETFRDELCREKTEGKKKNETMGNVVDQSRGGGQRKVTVKYGKNKNEVQV